MTLHDAILQPGLADPVHDAQAVFRQVLAALAEPGTVRSIGLTLDAPLALQPVTAALCLTLLDADTPLWLSRSSGADDAAVQQFLRFHCGCTLIDSPAEAAFAIVSAPDDLDLNRFGAGTPAYPDRSSTVWLQVDSLSDGTPHRLTGPGIADQAILRASGLPSDFAERWHANQQLFPCGIDLVFCCGQQLVGLPRTTTLARLNSPERACT